MRIWTIVAIAGLMIAIWAVFGPAHSEHRKLWLVMRVHGFVISVTGPHSSLKSCEDKMKSIEDPPGYKPTKRSVFMRHPIQDRDVQVTCDISDRAPKTTVPAEGEHILLLSPTLGAPATA
jgi:hypothetical protein